MYIIEEYITGLILNSNLLWIFYLLNSKEKSLNNCILFQNTLHGFVVYIWRLKNNFLNYFIGPINSKR